MMRARSHKAPWHTESLFYQADLVLSIAAKLPAGGGNLFTQLLAAMLSADDRAFS